MIRKRNGGYQKVIGADEVSLLLQQRPQASVFFSGGVIERQGCETLKKSG